MSNVKYCWAICYHEIGGFLPVKKEYEPSDEQYIGHIVFFDEQQAAETARRMNGE